MNAAIKKSNLLGVLSKYVAPIFYILLLVFLVLYVQSLDWSRLEGVQISWPYVIVATLFAISFRYWGAFIWFVLLKHLGATQLSNKKELVYIYAKSWLGRYIPGTAPWILGKIYFASKQGISKNKLAVSSLLEGILQIAVTLILGFLLLIFDARVSAVSQQMVWFMALILFLNVLILLPGIFNRIVSVAYKLVKKKTFDKAHFASTGIIVRGSLLYIIGATLSGLSFFFIAKSIYPELSYSDMLFVIGASNLASAFSMLAIFIPSGIGIREGVQVLLLSIIMPAEFALLIAVVTRLWSVAVDIMFFLINYVYRQSLVSNLSKE